MTLIDTSAWIEFFRGRKGWISERVDAELASGSPAICGPIFLEISRGLRIKKELKKVLGLFQACTWLREPEDLWEESGELGRYLGQRGFIAGSLDLLIAVHVLAHKVDFLTTDDDFERMVELGIPLSLLRPF